MARPPFCPSCGSTLSPTVQFCEQCGAPVPSTQPPPLPSYNTAGNALTHSATNPGNVLAWLKRSRLRLFLLVSLMIVIYGMFFLAIASIDKSVSINDNARVLDNARVRQAAQELPANVNIITVSGFTGTNQEFDARYGNHSSHRITLAIDTGHRHLTITGGKGISLSNSDYRDAVNTFTSTFQQQGYTGAMLATLDALRQDLYLAKIMQDTGYTIKTTTYHILGPVGTTIVWIILIIPLGLLTMLTGRRRSGRRRYRYSRSSSGGGGASGNF